MSEEYFKLDAVNWSTLKHFFKSPAHVKAYIDKGSEDSDAKSLGTLQHMALLEPEKLKDEYIAAPDFGHIKKTATTTSEQAKKNKEAKLQFWEDNQGKKIIPAKDFQDIIGMSQAIWSNAECVALLKSIEITESAITWEENGIKCKALIDMYSAKSKLIVDLKTTQDCRYHQFQKSAVNYGYFGQGTYYLRGAQKAGLKAEQFIWIAVESSAPYAVQLFVLPEFAINAYNNVIDVFLGKYNACKQTDHWPSYSVDFQALEVPDYHLSTLENIQ